MIYLVSLTETAESDMHDIHAYVELHDSLERADKLLEGIERTILSLANIPQHGHCPPELVKIGIRDFREIHFKPYRIIYSIRGQEVIVRSVLDGRRDMQTLLQQRLLR